MARRLYSNTSGSRIGPDSRESTSRTISSSSVASSKTTALSSSSLISVIQSSTTSSESRSLLGVRHASVSPRFDEEDSDDSSNFSENRLSPKPTIRKYGRTMHSQAFASISKESVPSSITSSSNTRPSMTTSPLLDHHWRSKERYQERDGQGNEDSKKAERLVDTIQDSFTNERRRIRSTVTESDHTSPRITRQILRNLDESEVKKGDESKDVNNVPVGRGNRLESGWRSRITLSSETTDSSDTRNDNNETERSLRRLRRQQRLEERREVSPATTSSLPKSSSDKELQELISREDSGIVDCNTTEKSSLATLKAEVRSSKEKLHALNGTDVFKRKGEACSSQVKSDVKITVISPEDDGGYEDSGVHLEEPPSPATDRWSGHVASSVKSQWTEEDLDEIVRQLSNPQHQVTKHAARGQADSPTGRKSSFDLINTDRDRIRGHLARSETDASSSYRELDTSFLEKERAGRNGDDDSKAGGLISGLSGLKIIKNKKLARSSHANAKRYALQKSRELHEAAASSRLYEDDDEVAEAAAPLRDVPSGIIPCSSSPEGSDGDVYGERRIQEPVPNDISKDVSKKRRFRKMLSRPLNRSQSAGCAKDVPAHALFLEQQRKKSQEAEWVEARKSRASEGDIRHAVRKNDSDDVEAESLSNNPSTADNKRSHIGKIHKTKSADSAMMAAEDFGAISQPKPKSRNIAKKISRKMLFLRRRHTDSTLGIMGKDEGARRLATVDPEEAKEWSKSFENLLFDKTGVELFRGFLMTEHSDENIEFWIACENYKNAKSSKQLPSLAMKIFNDYVAVQSKREINLDSKTRNHTYDSVTSNPTRQTFDEAQRRVQALMEKDSYRRFLESELYQDLAAGNIQNKS